MEHINASPVDAPKLKLWTDRDPVLSMAKVKKQLQRTVEAKPARFLLSYRLSGVTSGPVVGVVGVLKRLVISYPPMSMFPTIVPHAKSKKNTIYVSFTRSHITIIIRRIR